MRRSHSVQMVTRALSGVFLRNSTAGASLWGATLRPPAENRVEAARFGR